MKILVVCQYYYPEPFRITDICENLVKRGHEVTVITGLPNYPEGRVLDEYRHGKKRNEVINGVNIIRCFEIGRGSSNIKLFLNYISYALSATLKINNLNQKFDIVLVNQLSPVLMGIPAMAYKKKYHKKILLYCLDLWPDSLAAGGINEASLIYKVFYRISKWIYNSADTILVTSSMFNDYFNNTLKIMDINIELLPQYAEDIFINEDKNKPVEAIIRAENKIYNFVFAGNIGDMQSVETIIKAAGELHGYSNIVFHIIGEGSKLAECKKLAKDLELKNVKFYGRRPIQEMPKFYEMADAMLITFKDNKTLSYTLPGKVQTYMAAGKPIIGSANGETKLIIEEAKCGLCCEAENFKGLAELILKFCNSKNREQMAENALKYYLENYSKEKFFLKLENALKKLEA
ncbi:glycosyltransferase family 4 protein [Candidatus Clostridium stratigraminis]|uniref:Glycosyltransferase family 4 protein n=1 Tax=Candidatus Clostridium stratigraminis TaxID=3381661 RepID=A0ABW8T6I8_9CLOT